MPRSNRVLPSALLVFSAAFARCSEPSIAGLQTATAPQVSASASIVTVSRPTVQSGDTATLFVRTKDTQGRDIYLAGTAVTFSLTGGSSTGNIGPITDLKTGTYVAILTGQIAGGSATIAATINGTAAGNSAPAVIQVIPGPPDPDQSRLLVERFELAAGASMWIRLESHDQRGNRVTTGGHEVAFQSLPGTGTATAGPASDLQNGTYEARLTAGKAGSVNLEATIDSARVHSSLLPITVIGPGTPLLDATRLQATPSDIEPGKATVLLLTVRDSANRGVAGQQVHLDLSGTASGNLGEMVDHGDGTYTATYVASDTGWVEFVPVVNGSAAKWPRPMVWVRSPVTAHFSATSTTLGTLGGSASVAADINSAGQVVGWAWTAAGAQHAFLWTTTSGMTDLGTLPGDDWSTAVTITEQGDILGESGKSGATFGEPVLWSGDGTVKKLEIPLLPGGLFGAALDMNRYGYVVGWDMMSAVQEAWIWSATDGKYNITRSFLLPGRTEEGVASGMSDAGWTVGSRNGSCLHNAECYHAFLWKWSDGFMDLGIPGTDSTRVVYGRAVNDRNGVTGSTRAGMARERAYRWATGSGFTILPVDDDQAFSYGAAINLNDMVVGFEETQITGTLFNRAVAWPVSGGIVDLDPSCSGMAVAVNDVDVAVGYTDCGAGRRATMWTFTRASALAAVAPARRVSAARGQPSACPDNPIAKRSRGGLLSCLFREEN